MDDFTVTMTSAPARLGNGATFHCYRVGYGRYEWRSECGRARVWRNAHRGDGGTYSASIDGVPAGINYRTLTNALRNAGAKLQKPPPSTVNHQQQERQHGDGYIEPARRP